jgi:hypothetical protein
MDERSLELNVWARRFVAALYTGVLNCSYFQVRVHQADLLDCELSFGLAILKEILFVYADPSLFLLMNEEYYGGLPFREFFILYNRFDVNEDDFDEKMDCATEKLTKMLKKMDEEQQTRPDVFLRTNKIMPVPPGMDTSLTEYEAKNVVATARQFF